MSSSLHDLRYAGRTLGRSPGFAAVGVLTLALGIGANTATFTGVNAVVLHPLPFERLDRIVRIWQTYPERGDMQDMVSPADFLDWRAQSTSFEYMAAFCHRSVNLTGVDDPERLQGMLVSAAFFNVLGMPLLDGRTFGAENEQPGNDRVAVLSYGFWQRRFAGDRSALGSTIILNDHPYTISGVMPPDFDYPLGTDVWIPLAFENEQRQSRGGRFLFVLAPRPPLLSCCSPASTLWASNSPASPSAAGKRPCAAPWERAVGMSRGRRWPKACYFPPRAGFSAWFWPRGAWS